MSKTATAPLAHSLAHGAADNPREQGPSARSQEGFRTASIEERTAVLETRWEQTVPTLATSRDMADLRGEIRASENRLLKWGIGAGLALLAVVVALFTANTARIDALGSRIDRLDEKIDARFDAIMAELRELSR